MICDFYRGVARVAVAGLFLAIISSPRASAAGELCGSAAGPSGPIEGATLELRPVLDNFDRLARLLAEKGRPDPVAVATTDATGRYCVRLPPAGGVWRLEAELSSGSDATREGSPFRIRKAVSSSPFRPPSVSGFRSMLPVSHPVAGRWTRRTSVGPISSSSSTPRGRFRAASSTPGACPSRGQW